MLFLKGFLLNKSECSILKFPYFLPVFMYPNILDKLPMYVLVRLDSSPDYRHLLDFQDEALAARTEWTLAIGADSLGRARYSKLWHPFQNDVALFPGGWYKTLHMSYSGCSSRFSEPLCRAFINRFPNIQRLNIMFSCVQIKNVEAIETQFGPLLALIRAYAPNLVTFRLWAFGLLRLVRTRDREVWFSPLFQSFVPRLFAEVRQMTNLETLWLDLTDVPPPPLNFVPHGAPVVQLEALVERFNGDFPWLREFRYATSSAINFLAIVVIAHVGPAVERVFMPGHSQWYEQWATIRRVFARKFHEISVLMGPAAVGNLVEFFNLFNVLTRIEVQLIPDGPRILELFRALAKLPNLQVLKVVNFHSPLIHPDDAQDIVANGLAPLHNLNVLTIHMNFQMDSCAQISFGPLFGNDAAQPPIVVPNLVCFEMSVRGGACRQLRHNQTTCVIYAVNQWFALLRHALFVKYTNLANDIQGGRHVVGGFLGADCLMNPHPLPEVLHQ